MKVHFLPKHFFWLMPLFMVLCPLLSGASVGDPKKTPKPSANCEIPLGGGSAETCSENKTKDKVFRDIAHKYGNPPAVHSMWTYGAVPEDIPLFRGVTGPDHDLESVLRFIGGDRRYDLMSPTFRRTLESALKTEVSFETAYEMARTEVASEIRKRIESGGLDKFAFAALAETSTGRAPEEKMGPIIKFTNELNGALNYAGANFEKNLAEGRPLNPVVFDASGNGGLVLGETRAPKPGVGWEYDFLSNVSIRHIKAIYVGLIKPDSTSIWGMPWIKITPLARGEDGAFRTFSVELVNIERKIPMEIFQETKVWPTGELTNLTPRKRVGLFNLSGPIQLSPDLSKAELEDLKPLFKMLNGNSKH